MFPCFFFFNRPGMPKWLGSSRTLVFPHYRHPNPKVEKRSIDVPEAGCRSRQNHNSQRKSIHLRSSSQAENSHTLWSMARTSPQERSTVLLGGRHSSFRLHGMGTRWTKRFSSTRRRGLCPQDWGKTIVALSARTVEWCSLQFAGHSSFVYHPSCALPEENCHGCNFVLVMLLPVNLTLFYLSSTC